MYNKFLTKMKGHDLCIICFHHIKNSGVFVNKNLWKIYEQLSEIKLEEPGGICSLCHSRLRHAQQLFLLAARTEHLHNSTESDEIEEKLTFTLLEQSDVLNYSVPKYEDQIKYEVSKDSNTIHPGTSKKTCVNEIDSKIFCKETLKPLLNDESNIVLKKECLYIINRPENFNDSSPELPLPSDPLLTPVLPLEFCNPLSEFLEDPLLEPSNLKNRHPPPEPKKFNRKTEYSCEHCEMKFAWKIKLKQHYNQVHKQRTFICQLCGMNCKYRTRLRDHMRVHTGEKPYTCDDCGQSFIALATLKRHILVTHRNYKPYVCSTCDKAFFDRSALRVHLRWHSGERPFACDCGTRFATASGLKMHHRSGAHERIQRHGCHGRTSRRTCSCGRIFQTDQRMNLHQIHKGCPRTALPSLPPSGHRCHCGKEFNSRVHLKSHMRVHLMFEVGKFLCPVCGNTYTSADVLATHLFLHPFSRNCVSCRTTCANKEDLKLHIRQFHSNPSGV